MQKCGKGRRKQGNANTKGEMATSCGMRCDQQQREKSWTDEIRHTALQNSQDQNTYRYLVDVQSMQQHIKHVSLHAVAH